MGICWGEGCMLGCILRLGRYVGDLLGWGLYVGVCWGGGRYVGMYIRAEEVC